MCTACGEGKYSTAGGVGEGQCTVCPAGSFTGVADGGVACSRCADGAFSEGNQSACTSCGPGTYSLGGSSQCSLCDEHMFQATGGASSCVTCHVCNTTTEVETAGCSLTSASVCDCKLGYAGTGSAAGSGTGCAACTSPSSPAAAPRSHKFRSAAALWERAATRVDGRSRYSQRYPLEHPHRHLWGPCSTLFCDSCKSRGTVLGE